MSNTKTQTLAPPPNGVPPDFPVTATGEASPQQSAPQGHVIATPSPPSISIPTNYNRETSICPSNTKCNRPTDFLIIGASHDRTYFGNT